MSSNRKLSALSALSPHTAYPYLNIPKSPLDFNSSRLQKINKSSIFASYLAHPYLDIPKEFGFPMHNETNAIYAFLKDNKVLLRSLNNGLRSAHQLTKKEKLVEKLVQEHELFAEANDFAFRLRQEVLEIAKTLTENGVNLLFIKPFGNLPLDSDNFDILVKKTAINKARGILEALGFTELSWLREYEWLGDPHKFLYRRVHNEIILTLHLHTQVAWEGMKFLDENDLWDRHREIDIDGTRLCFPSSEHHLLITIAHALFENKYLKLSDLIYIVESLGPRNEVDWSYVADWAFKDNWLKPFYAFLRLADRVHSTLFERRLVEEDVFDSLAKKAQISGEELAERKLIDSFENERLLPMKVPLAKVAFQYIEKILRNPSAPSTHKVAKILSLSWSYIRKRMPAGLRAYAWVSRAPAFVVCFSGQDGTGKTEHAMGLCNELKKRGIRASYVWSRGAGLSLKPLLPLGRLITSSNRLSSTSGHAGKRQELLKKEPLRTLWAYVALADELLQLFTKARIPLSSGRIVICDRHILDVLVDLKCELGKNIGYVSEQIIKSAAPRPRITFVLDAEPKEILLRKEAGNLDFVKCKRHNYLVRSRLSRSAIIDTGKSFDQNQREILTLFMKVGYLERN